MDNATLRILVGVLGNIISGLLFLSPVPTMMKIVKAKSVQAFKPDPYVATVLNCAMWAFYALPIVHPDSLLVITINVAGFTLEFIYVIIFFIYSSWGGRKKLIIILVVEAVFVAVVAVITLTFFHTHEKRSMIVGLICIVFNILMYISPLTVMSSVIKTKSVKYLPLPLAVASFLNGIVWCVYALLQFDPYMLAPNALGTISSIVQLVLYATYYSTTNWDEDETGEVQMSGSSNNA